MDINPLSDVPVNMFCIQWVIFLLCWWFPLLCKNFLVWCSPTCLSIFFFCFPCLGRYFWFKKKCYKQCRRFCSLCFLLGFCMVLGLPVKSLIHFEFILACGVRKWSSFILLHISVQCSQHHLLNKPSLAHCMCFLPL